MLRSIRDFFNEHIQPDSQTGRANSHTVTLACTALLVEMMGADRESLAVEQSAVIDAITSQFDLDATEAADLVALADRELADANDYYQFTSLINEAFSPEQKLQVLESLWRVAYADEQINAHERHLMRKLADLLHVPHGDHMLAKDRARNRTQSEQ